MFRTVPLSIIRSFSLYTQQWYMSYSLWAGSGWNILILLTSCHQTCMTHTIAVCTVKNSWWWTEELSETCRFSIQNKFEKLVHLAGFITGICHNARSHEHKKKRDCGVHKESWFNSQQGQVFDLLSKICNPSQGPTKLPFSGYWWLSLAAVRWLVHAADDSPLSSAPYTLMAPDIDYLF